MMTTKFKAGDRVYLVGGNFDTCTFGIWTGTVEKHAFGYWVLRDGESVESYWTSNAMFRDRRAAVSYANERLADHQKSLAAQLESTNQQYAAAVDNCPATLDAPVASR